MTPDLGLPQQIDDPTDPFIGQIVDSYRIDRRIGQGGMGVVYRAKHNISNEIVAIKVMNERYAQDLSYRRRFQREANSCSKLKHDGLVKVYKHLELSSGQPCLIMEYIEGETLSIRLKRDSKHRFDTHTSLVITELVAEAISVAHQHEIIHLDLKPDNIIIRHSSDSVRRIWPVVLDFGIARLLNADTSQTNLHRSAIGTPAYMSPEQCQGDANLTKKSDVYALGCILYEMICGQPPFVENPERLLLLHPNQAPRRPRLRNRSIPVSLDRLILDMLQKNPEMRPSMTDVSERCRQIRTGCSGSFWPQYHRWLTAGCVIFLLGFLFALNTTTLHGRLAEFVGRRDGQNVHLSSAWEEQGSLPSTTQALIEYATITGSAGSVVHRVVPDAGGSANGPADTDNNQGRLFIDGGDDRAGNSAVDMSSPGHILGPFRVELGQRENGGRGIPEPKSHQCQFQLQLERRPSAASSTRILINGRIEHPLNIPPAVQHDDGWFSSVFETLAVDFSDSWVKDVEILVEIRDRHGCIVAVGSQIWNRDGNCNQKVNLVLEDPLISGYAYLRVNKRIPGDAAEARLGTIIVEEVDLAHRRKSSLLECGERCECAVPARTKLRISAIGSDPYSFTGFSVPACRGQNANPCEVSVDELPSHEISVLNLPETILPRRESRIEGRFHHWKASPGFPSAVELDPPLIRLSQRQQNFYLERKKHWSSAADFANPAHLRSVHALSNSRVFLAGFGGTLTIWNREQNSLLTQQVGERLNDDDDTKNDEQLHGRLTDFHAIRELADRTVVAAGSDESLVNDTVRETSRIWHNDGQGWSPVLFFRIEDTPNKTPVTMPRILSISDAETLDDVLLGGLDSFSIHRYFGRVSQTTTNRHIWAIARQSSEGRFWLVGGGRDNPSYAESTILSYDQRSGLIRHSTGYDNAYRAVWINNNRDGDIWIAGMPSPSGNPAVERFHIFTDRFGAINLKSAYSCERGELPPQVFGIWGTANDNVWAAGKDRVVHCNGVDPWRLMYRSPEPNVELVALWGLPDGEIWAVGFVRTPSQGTADEGRTDHSIIIRILHR